jgi:hypothetical protein
LSKLRSFGEEEKRYEENNDEKEWNNECEGEDGRKNGRNKKRDVTIHHHLFVSTP